MAIVRDNMDQVFARSKVDGTNEQCVRQVIKRDDVPEGKIESTQKRLGISYNSLVEVFLLSTLQVATRVVVRDIVGNHSAIRISEGESRCYDLPSMALESISFNESACGGKIWGFESFRTPTMRGIVKRC